MPSEIAAVPDPLTGREVSTFDGSAMPLGTNTQVYPASLSAVGAQEFGDQRVIDLQRERVRRLRARQNEDQRLERRIRIRPDEVSPEKASKLALLQNWYVLSQSGISSRNFGRLQNAVIQFEGMVCNGSARTLYSGIRLFLKFWSMVQEESQEPELHVATSGRLQAIWSHRNGWFLVIEFGGDDSVFWAIYQDADIVEGQQRPATIAQLAQNLQALVSKPLKWRC